MHRFQKKQFCPEKKGFTTGGAASRFRQIKQLRKGIPMKKIICKVEYDTEASELIAKRTNGEFGDPAGYEERLYKTEGGKFFLYTVGGAESKYAEEGIKRMSAANADKWLAENN